MFKTFLAGIILGIAACAAALYFIPVVDQYREVSMISVSPNGGNVESYHANIPMDRIMIGAPDQKGPLPVGLEWPSDGRFADARAELFKIRNGKDVVIGVASRVALSGDVERDTIEWVLHLPARGSLYVAMHSEPQEAGYRVGKLLQGTREFGTLQGQLTERWVADASGEDGAPAGRIELQTSFVAMQADQ